MSKKNKDLKITIIGAGSNTLFRDNGIKGAVIKLGSNFSYTKLLDKNTIEVGASTLDRKVASFAKDKNLTNFEFLSCIPGSIGGAVVMNSGCYENDISQILHSIKVVDINKMEEKEIKKEEIDFYYRGTSLPSNLIILSVTLKGLASSKDKIEKKQKDFIERKKFLNQVKSRPAEVHLKISAKTKRLGCILKKLVAII